MAKKEDDGVVKRKVVRRKKSDSGDRKKGGARLSALGKVVRRKDEAVKDNDGKAGDLNGDGKKTEESKNKGGELGDLKNANNSNEDSTSDGSNNVKQLTKLELMELDLNQARVDMQATVLQNLGMKEELLRIDYTTKRDGIRSKQRETQHSMEDCKHDYNRTRAAIQERYGVNLDKCTVRQDGTIIEVDENGNPMSYVGDPSGG